MSTNNANTERTPGSDMTIHEVGSGCYAISAAGCPNTGVIVGERGLLVIDAQPTPELSRQTLAKIREISDKPIKVLLLTHFHGDSTAGASAFDAGEIIASDLTKRMMETRGLDDQDVLKSRFPDIYPTGQPVQPLAVPTMTIASSMSIDLGGKEVRVMHLGRGHTMGDLLVWVPDNGVIYVGDMVQTKAAAYCGDAHLTDWPRALDRIAAFRPKALVPSRGRPAVGTSKVTKSIETTRDFIVTLRDAAAACVEANMGLRDTYRSVAEALHPRFKSFEGFAAHLPFNVARAYDEAQGLDQPQIWTRERCADLDDALTRTAPVAEIAEVSEDAEVPATAADGLEEPKVDAAEEPSGQILPEDPAVEAGGAPPEVPDNTSELVTDSDFAASLLAGDADTGPGENDTLLLEEDEVVTSDAEDQAELEKADA